MGPPPHPAFWMTQIFAPWNVPGLTEPSLLYFSLCNSFSLPLLLLFPSPHDPSSGSFRFPGILCCPAQMPGVCKPTFSGTPCRNSDPLLFTKKRNGAQRCAVTYLRSHSPEQAEPWLKLVSVSLFRDFPLTVAISQEEPPIQTPAPALEHSVPCSYAGETHLGLYLLLGVHVLMSSPLSSEKVPMRMECEQSEPGLDRRCVALPSKSIA